MVYLHVKMGMNVIYYKNYFSDEFQQLNFLSVTRKKQDVPIASCRKACNKGISSDRKQKLIAKLRPIVPENRLKFW